MIRALAFAIAVMLSTTPSAAADAGFTPAQRAEIVSIVRDAMKADPSILRDAVVSLQADEAHVQEAAARIAVARATPVLTATAADPVEGAANGDVTMVQFYDVRCPYCRRMLPTVAALLAADPLLRLVDKDIPILGPPSVLGARALLAAQRQAGYVRLRDRLMSGTPDITIDVVHAAANDGGLDWARLQRDMNDPAIAERLEANVTLAHNLGIDGTPAFEIGGHVIAGAVSLSELQAAVAAARAPHG